MGTSRIMATLSQSGKMELGKENRVSFNTIISAPRWQRFALAVAALGLVYWVPLWHLVRFAAASELYSYILLIPTISLYLVWLRRTGLSLAPVGSKLLGGAFFLFGLALLAVYWGERYAHGAWPKDEALVMTTLSFLSCFYGIVGLFWGGAALRAATFPWRFSCFWCRCRRTPCWRWTPFCKPALRWSPGGCSVCRALRAFKTGWTFSCPISACKLRPNAAASTPPWCYSSPACWRGNFFCERLGSDLSWSRWSFRWEFSATASGFLSLASFASMWARK